MTTPYPVDPTGIQAALARRLGVALPNGQTPFDPSQFSVMPHIYATSGEDNGDAQEQAAMQQKQYMENMQMFNKPSNSNRKRSQNAQTADTSPSVIY